MALRIHNLMALLIAAVLAVAILAPGKAQAEPWTSYVAQWEELEEERQEARSQLQALSQEHQKFVEAIEKLKAEQAPRRELEAKLRRNMRVVEALEELQREIQIIDSRQEAARSAILRGLDQRREQLEEALRSGSGQRLQIVAELNELQRSRRQFVAPLPQADQRRVAQALELARRVGDDHPRAMLSAADELEDTEEQVIARLRALDNRIAELEQAQRLQRRSRSFGEYNSFFEEDQRGRTVARYEQAVVTRRPDHSSRGPGSEREAGDEEAEATPEAGTDDGTESEDVAHFDGREEEFDHNSGEAPAEDPSGSSNDPFENVVETETVVITSEVDAGLNDISYLSERAVERDLERLRRERQSLENQADELRQKADELRRRARDAR